MVRISPVSASEAILIDNPSPFTLPIYGTTYTGRSLEHLLSADKIMRDAASIPFPLFTVQIVNKIGFDWTCSLLGFISLVLRAGFMGIQQIRPGVA